ncbi:MAG TPA: hypothetical protein VI457_05815 [Methylococcaceae bacterium]|nr:hypothetical protein [Methylococcaceae bacterium]
MKTWRKAGFLAMASWLAPPVWAYGGGGGGSQESCTPHYYANEIPAQNADVAGVPEVSFTATDNTATHTLVVKVNGQSASLTVSPLGNGKFSVVGKLPQAVTQAGKAQISIHGKSKDGCDKLFVYYVTIRKAP